jgi:uncharacterized membrane protein
MNSLKKQLKRLSKFLSVLALFLVNIAPVYAAEGDVNYTHIWVYILFALVVAIAAAEGIYIAYLKIFKSESKSRKNKKDED